MDDKPVTRRRRIRLQPQPIPENQLKMNRSRWKVLEAVSKWGGVVSKPHLARLIYPKNVEAAAFYRISDRKKIRRWIKKYGEEYVWLRLQALGSLQTVLKISQLPEITHSQDLTWWEWIQDLKESQPEVFTELQEAVTTLQKFEHIQRDAHPELAEAWVVLEKQYSGDLAPITEIRRLHRRLDQLTAAAWLEQAIEEDWTQPTAFAQRPRFQKDVVSHHADSELRYLTDAGLITPLAQAVDEDHRETCYYLTRTGRKLLAKYHGVSAREIYQRPPGFNPTKLSHRMGQNRLRLAMTLSAEKAGYTIKTWLDTWQVEKALHKTTVKLPQRQTNQETKQPEVVWKSFPVKYFDDLVVLETLGVQGHFLPMLIEFDNGSEIISSPTSQETIEQKYRTLGELLRTGKIAEVFPHINWSNGGWIVTVTAATSMDRLELLYDAAMEILGEESTARDRYWFCRVADAKPSLDAQFAYTVFQEPIWLRGGMGKQNFQVMRPEIRG